jgi:hypothetical protein
MGAAGRGSRDRATAVVDARREGCDSRRGVRRPQLGCRGRRASWRFPCTDLLFAPADARTCDCGCRHGSIGRTSVRSSPDRPAMTRAVSARRHRRLSPARRGARRHLKAVSALLRSRSAMAALSRSTLALAPKRWPTCPPAQDAELAAAKNGLVITQLTIDKPKADRQAPQREVRRELGEDRVQRRPARAGA